MNYPPQLDPLISCLPSTVGTLQTIGYVEEQAEQRVADFLAQPRTALIDIRFSPRSRWRPAWNKSALLEKYGPLQYTHVKALGNVNYNKPGEPIQLLDPDEYIRKIVRVLQQGMSIMLVCACKNYHSCHRKVVYDLVQSALVVAEAERQAEQEAEATKPRMDVCPAHPHIMTGSLPDGRTICVSTDVFVSALDDMPMDYLNDPLNWCSSVDGRTCWIEGSHGVQA